MHVLKHILSWKCCRKIGSGCDHNHWNDVDREHLINLCHRFVFKKIFDEESLFNHLISSPSSAWPPSARVGAFGPTHRKLGRQIGLRGSFQALWGLFCEAALFKHNVGSLFTCGARVQSCIPQSAAKPAQCPRPLLSSDPHVNTALWAAGWTSHT